MPAKNPDIGPNVVKRLKALGTQIQAQRKHLGVSAAATAEASGLSRVTLHRIEKGVASVTMGAYLSVIFALGLKLDLSELNPKQTPKDVKALPDQIILSHYPQMKRLAWQLKDTTQLSPQAALQLYERNWRHIDFASMEESERQLLTKLLAAFGRERPLV